MFDEKDWEEIAKEYYMVKKEERAIQLKLKSLRDKMASELPDGVDKIKTKKGNIVRYNSFRKWIFSGDVYERIAKEKEDGTAIKEVGEVITLVIKRKKKK